MRNHARTEKRRPQTDPLPDDVELDDFPLPEVADFTVDIERAQVLKKIDRYLDTLTEGDRSIYLLRTLHEMPYAAIAHLAGGTAGSVRTKLYRIREEIRAELGLAKDPPEPPDPKEPKTRGPENPPPKKDKGTPE